MIDNISSNKIKENKYKILRMSLLLGNNDEREDTINNFEDASREIDAMNDEVYLKDIEKKFYDTMTLEEEEKKLTELVDYIGGRIEQRISLLSDFSNVTGFELTNLPPIKHYEKLDELKERLEYIREYLGNIDTINKLKNEISELENILNNAYVKKAKSEEKNSKDEIELLNRFNNIVRKLDVLKEVDSNNINEKLEKAIERASDSKKSLDIFDKSFATLSNSGISEAEKKEYLSYVTGAKDDYYTNKEMEYLLRLYVLFNSTETEYIKILDKRENINDLIHDRLNLRDELNIKNIDKLSSIYETLEKQYEEIKKQRENLDEIERLTTEINNKKDESAELERDNTKVEILALLKEFCIIDTYDDINFEDINTEKAPNIMEDEENKILTEEIKDEPQEEIEISNINFDINEDLSLETVGEIPEQDESTEENIESTENDHILEEEPLENEVVAIKDASNINIEDAKLKSNNVMKRVGEMLGVKVEETKIVNVDLKDDKEVSKIEEKELDSKIDNEEVIVNNDKEQNIQPEENNIFINTNFDADPETNEMMSNKETTTINPMFSNALGNNTLDDIMSQPIEESNDDSLDFWSTNEETPLDLNSLPDLDSNDTFFSTNINNNENNSNNNNGMPELNFPDFDMNFSEGDEEENND